MAEERGELFVFHWRAFGIGKTARETVRIREGLPQRLIVNFRLETGKGSS